MAEWQSQEEFRCCWHLQLLEVESSSKTVKSINSPRHTTETPVKSGFYPEGKNFVGEFKKAEFSYFHKTWSENLTKITILKFI